MDEEKILPIVRQQGPSIPVQISKKIGTNILFASAMMGDLASKGKLKMTHVKVGGTPLYYIPGQESALQQFSKHLHEKERKAYELLRASKVLRDVELEPVIRVALREIKDFAVPLEVSFNNGVEIFWKWYLLSKDEASRIIRSIIEPVQSQGSTSANSSSLSSPLSSPKTTISSPAKSEVHNISSNQFTKPPAADKSPTKSHVQSANTPPQSNSKADENSNVKPIKQGSENSSSQEVLKRVEQDEPFANNIYAFFRSKDIELVREKLVRKGSDLEFVARVPSNIGKLLFFVKARSKKTSNDGDLSSAFIQGEKKNLPVLYLTTGKVTKKAKSTASKDFPSMVIEEI